MLLSAARPATCARGTYHPVVKGYRDGFTGRGRLFQSCPDILRESDQEGRRFASGPGGATCVTPGGRGIVRLVVEDLLVAVRLRGEDQHVCEDWVSKPD